MSGNFNFNNSVCITGSIFYPNISSSYFIDEPANEKSAIEKQIEKIKAYCVLGSGIPEDTLVERIMKVIEIEKDVNKAGDYDFYKKAYFNAVVQGKLSGDEYKITCKNNYNTCYDPSLFSGSSSSNISNISFLNNIIWDSSGSVI